MTATIPLRGQRGTANQLACASEGLKLRNGHSRHATQVEIAVAAQTSPATKIDVNPTSAPSPGNLDSATDQGGTETQESIVGSAPKSSPGPATDPVEPMVQPPVLVDAELAVLANQVADLETFRTACANQLEVMTRVGVDKDGGQRGFGLEKHNPAVLLQAHMVDNLRKLEDQSVKELEKHLKKSPLGPWVLSQRGIGFKTIARLLAAIGDPYWNDLHDRPRLVSELWSYCGYGDAAVQVKQKGQRVGWSPEAKMRGFLCIEPSTKMLRKPCYSVKDDETGLVIETIHVEGCTCSPWRKIYDEEKAKYAGSVHNRECVRCTGRGQAAAPIGSPRKAAHVNQIAIRNTTKKLLKALWLEAKRLHEQA